MNIKIICIGKVKEACIQDAILEYIKRIKKYSSIEILESLDESIPDNPSQKEIDIIKKKEAEKIKKFIKPNDYVISLDLTGKELTSPELSEKISSIFLNRF